MTHLGPKSGHPSPSQQLFCLKPEAIVLKCVSPNEVIDEGDMFSTIEGVYYVKKHTFFYNKIGQAKFQFPFLKLFERYLFN